MDQPGPPHSRTRGRWTPPRRLLQQRHQDCWIRRYRQCGQQSIHKRTRCRWSAIAAPQDTDIRSDRVRKVFAPTGPITDAEGPSGRQRGNQAYRPAADSDATLRRFVRSREGAATGRAAGCPHRYVRHRVLAVDPAAAHSEVVITRWSLGVKHPKADRARLSPLLTGSGSTRRIPPLSEHVHRDGLGSGPGAPSRRGARPALPRGRGSLDRGDRRSSRSLAGDRQGVLLRPV